MNTRRKPQEHSDINVVLHMPPESVYYLLRNAVHATNNKTIEFQQIDDDNIIFCINQHIGNVTTHTIRGEITRIGKVSHISARVDTEAGSWLPALASSFNFELTSLTALYLCAMLFILGITIIPLQFIVMIGMAGFIASSALITVGIYSQLPEDLYFWMSDLITSNPPVIHSTKQKIQRPAHLQHDSLTVDMPLEACIDLLMHNINSGQAFDVDVINSRTIHFKTIWIQDNIQLRLFGKTHDLYVEGTARTLDDGSTQIDYDYYDHNQLGTVWRMVRAVGYMWLSYLIVASPFVFTAMFMRNSSGTISAVMGTTLSLVYLWCWSHHINLWQLPLHQTYIGRSLFVTDKTSFKEHHIQSAIQRLSSRLNTRQEKLDVTSDTQEQANSSPRTQNF